MNAIKPIAHLVWLQGMRAPDDVEDYFEVARPGDKCVDGSDAFPVFGADAFAAKDAQISELRSKLFPYADATEISGISWDGKYLIGDKKSISYFHEMKNRGEQIDVYKRAYDQNIAAKDAEIKLFREALNTEFCVLFLDGRNEHGSHVLASYPRSFDVVDGDVSEQAEAILVAAENEGFQIGQHVWAEFDWVAPQYGDEGRVELSGYWDFRLINVEMTRAALAKAGEA